MSDQYLEAEKRLAELLGWKQIEVYGSHQTDLRGLELPFDEQPRAIPKWARDNEAAFSLMAAHCSEPSFQPGAVKVSNGEYSFTSDYQSHDGVEAALRYAIVMSLAKSLEAIKS